MLSSVLWWDDDSGLEDLMDVEDADELCRQLLASPSGWGSSTRHMEAVDLLGELDGLQKAVRRARSDPNATVRKSRPQIPDASGLFQA